MEEDYVFRYRLELERDKNQPPLYSDRLVEMIRVQLEELLNIVILTEGDRELKPDGFKMLCNLDNVYKIFPDLPGLPDL